MEFCLSFLVIHTLTTHSTAAHLDILLSCLRFTHTVLNSLCARSDISLNELFPCSKRIGRRITLATYIKMASNTYPSKPSKTGSSYAPRSSSTYTPNPSQSIYANSATSSRSNRGYGSKPTSVVVHNGGGQTYDTSSSSTGNAGYYN